MTIETPPIPETKPTIEVIQAAFAPFDESSTDYVQLIRKAAQAKQEAAVLAHQVKTGEPDYVKTWAAALFVAFPYVKDFQWRYIRGSEGDGPMDRAFMHHISVWTLSRRDQSDPLREAALHFIDLAGDCPCTHERQIRSVQLDDEGNVDYKIMTTIPGL